MGAVAHWRLGGVLAAAEPDIAVLLGLVFQRAKRAAFVGAVAERLLGRHAADTPPIGFAGFHRCLDRRFLGDDRLVRHLVFLLIVVSPATHSPAPPRRE